MEGGLLEKAALYEKSGKIDPGPPGGQTVHKRRRDYDVLSGNHGFYFC
jgi:hypothetical protein